MPRAGKSQRQRPARSASEQDHKAVAVSQPAVPAETGSGAVVRRLLRPPESPLPARRSRRVRRWSRWLLAAALLLTATAPVVSWLRYQALHVTSTNAVVRGHLAEIGTRLDGLVTRVEVSAGDRVTAGQVLVRLEDSHLRAEVHEAMAELEGLKRTLEVERLSIAHERRQLRQQAQEAVANVDAAQAQAAAAGIRLDGAREAQQLRQSLLDRGGAVSGEDVRDAEISRRTAEALLQEAQAKHVAAQSAEQKVRLTADALAIRDRQIGVLEADVQRAQARLMRAEADLAAASIRAPENGAIVHRMVELGASVEVGQPIISMLLGEEVWVEAWVDENDIAAVGVGNEARVTLQAFPGREFSGKVDKLGVATDFEMPASEVPQPRHSRMRGSPVVGVRIRLEDPSAELLPGLSAVVAIRKSPG